MRRPATVLDFRISSETLGRKPASRLEMRSSATFRQLHVALASLLGASLAFAEFFVKRSPIGNRVILRNPIESVPWASDETAMRGVRLDAHFKAPGDVAYYYPYPADHDGYEILLEAIVLARAHGPHRPRDAKPQPGLAPSLVRRRS